MCGCLLGIHRHQPLLSACHSRCLPSPRRSWTAAWAWACLWRGMWGAATTQTWMCWPAATAGCTARRPRCGGTIACRSDRQPHGLQWTGWIAGCLTLLDGRCIAQHEMAGCACTCSKKDKSTTNATCALAMKSEGLVQPAWQRRGNSWWQETQVQRQVVKWLGGLLSMALGSHSNRMSPG